MSDDDFVEGDSGSEAADAPGAVPADDTPRERAEAKQGGFDSSSTMDAPVMRRSVKTSHTQAARKAFAEAIVANKAKPAAPVPAGEAAELDPEGDAAPIAAKADATQAKANAAEPPAKQPIADAVLAAPSAPPAPSLDPEVRKLKEQLAAERKALADERAEFERSRKAPEPVAKSAAVDLETYIEAAPRAFRSWLESMRGEPLTDEEYKSEISDFITQSSAEVLGVPLPEATRVRLEAALARKAVKTNRTIQAKRDAARQAAEEKAHAEQAERQSAEEVERQWSAAAQAVGQQFAPTQDATGKPTASQAAAAYPWLAAEDNPGQIVVDVIRAAAAKDGTQMSWQEASKRADEYLATQWKGSIEKRKALFEPAVAPKPSPTPAPAAPPAPPVEQPRAVASPSKWTRDKHMESTKAAFRKALGGQ